MGKKKSKMKVVLDTNVLISALLFRKETSKITGLWKTRAIVPVFSKETFDEFRRVLEYRKFSLTEDEINSIIYEEALPYFDVIEVKSEVKGVSKDPDDDKFISCALSSGAKFIVSGDSDLYEITNYKNLKIIQPSELINIFIKV